MDVAEMDVAEMDVAEMDVAEMDVAEIGPRPLDAERTLRVTENREPRLRLGRRRATRESPTREQS